MSNEKDRIVELEELRTRVAELEQRMIDQANMICKKANEADMERRTAEMHCADAVKLSKRVEELEKEKGELNFSLKSRFNDWLLRGGQIKSLEFKLSTLLKASEGMEKALEDIKYHADNPFASKNGEANRKWLAYCQDVAIIALADFRAVRDGK